MQYFIYLSKIYNSDWLNSFMNEGKNVHEDNNWDHKKIINLENI